MGHPDLVAPAVLQGPTSWRVLRTFHYSLKDHIEDHVPDIEVPVLVVRGEREPICRADWAERLTTRLLARGCLVETPKVAHTLVYTAPAELAAPTRSFLADNLADDGRPPRHR